jgi:hypothetical protein
MEDWKMRRTLWIIALALTAMLTPTVLRAADITYTVDETVGAGIVTGSITTDGTIGTLDTADIVNWDLTLNDGSNPTFDLLGPTSGDNSQEIVEGSDLTATATQLLFDFSGSDDGYFLLENSVIGDDGPFVCYTATTDCSGAPVGVNLDVLSPETNIVYTELSGTDVIAGSAGVVGTPEPSTAFLLLMGIVPMIVMRKRIAQGLRLDTGTRPTLSPN